MNPPHGVHAVGHPPPGGQGVVTEQPRHVVEAARRLVDVAALGHDDAERLRAAGVVGGDVLPRHAVR
jgi:hypothetical protein